MWKYKKLNYHGYNLLVSNPIKMLHITFGWTTAGNGNVGFENFMVVWKKKKLLGHINVITMDNLRKMNKWNRKAGHARATRNVK